MFDGTTASLSESDTDDESVVNSFICGRDLRPYFFDPTTNFGDTSLAGELFPLLVIVSLRSSVIVEDNCWSEIFKVVCKQKILKNFYIFIYEFVKGLAKIRKFGFEEQI